jgi:hypothetical protein
MRLLKQLVAVAAVAFAGSMGVHAVQGNPLLTLVLGVATAVILVFVYARVVRWSERRAPVEVAAKGAPAAFGRGLLIGVGMFTAVIVNIAFLGDYRVEGWGSVMGAVGLLGFMAAAAAGIFGAEVSGNGTPQGLLDGVTSGPALLTGGEFGPEASLYAVVFGVLLTVVFMWLARRRGNVVPLRRGSRADATPTLAQ